MKFALNDGKKVEPKKGAKGFCPVCGSVVIAKCGETRIHHWAHKGIRNCDPWWENETEWHRAWKANFPIEWQEVVHRDNKGERHIADVRTNHSLIIEFQHSYITREELRSRENFYGNMVWVVDGTRLKRDYQRFQKGQRYWHRTNVQGYYSVQAPDKCFPSAWLESSVPVIFDFLGMESVENSNDLRNFLFCLFPKQSGKETILAVFSRDLFIENTKNGQLFSKQDPQQSSSGQPSKRRIYRSGRRGTHYFDPRKKRFVRRRRL